MTRLLPTIAVTIALAFASTLTAATFTVTNANTGGAGSLADAISSANANAGADTITFNIPGGGVQTILGNYSITDDVTIDATTQPGYAGSPLIEIDGSGSTIFFVQASATIRGFSLIHFGDAILITSNAGTTNISANYIGLEADGVTGNGGGAGVFVADGAATAGDSHNIGSGSASDRNVIANSNYGVIASNGTVANVSVQGNFIGTQADGSTAAPNGTGIFAFSYSPVLIGDQLGNTIAHNAIAGVQVGDGSAEILQNSFYDNGIGIDNAGGNVQMPNAPVLLTAVSGASTTQVTGNVSTALAFEPLYLEFFSNPVDENQGRTYLGRRQVTTDGSGNNVFSVTLNTAVPGGTYITATATAPRVYQTTEFAQDILVTAAVADLTITKTTTASTVNVGDTIDYTITVSNAGPDSATGVVVTDPLPPGTTLESVTPSQGSCSGTTTVTCNMNTIANGASATIALTLRVTAAGDIANSASVTEFESDPNGGLAATASTVTAAATASVPTLSPSLLLALAALLAAVALVRQ